MSELKESTKVMSDSIKKDFKLGTGGVVEVSPDIYSKSLEAAGIDEKHVKAIQKHNSEFFASTMHAVGEIAVAAMKKDKKLDQVSVEIPLFKDSIAHAISREKEVMAGMPKDGERQTKTAYGFVTSKYVTDVTGSKGEAKKVRAHISALAEEAFGK